MTGNDRNVMQWAVATTPGQILVGAGRSRALIDGLAAALFAGFVLFTAAYALLRPDYNWDMVAYVATALEDRYADPVDLHRETWSAIEQGARDSQLYNLQYGNPYNRHQWENPADFQSQLSMYRVKVAYIQLLRWIEPVTGIAFGSMLLSVIPSFAVGLLLMVWLMRENAIQGAFVLIPILMIADYVRMTTAVTPDMLLALVSLLALYCYARGREALACVLLVASVFIRPDNIILVFAMLVTAVMFGWRILPLLAAFVAAFVSCVAISKFGHHPGWWAHFYFSCLEIQNSMTGFHPDFSLVAMVRGYVRGVMVALMNNDWPALLVLLVAAWALLQRFGRTSDVRLNGLVFAVAIGTLGKFVSFPLPDDRFYFVFIAGMATVLTILWKPRFDLVGAEAPAGLGDRTVRRLVRSPAA